MKKLFFLLTLLLAATVAAAPTVDERLERLEHTIVHIQKLKGIPGPVGPPGIPGPRGLPGPKVAPSAQNENETINRLRAKIDILEFGLLKITVMVVVLAMYVVFWK